MHPHRPNQILDTFFIKCKLTSLNLLSFSADQQMTSHLEIALMSYNIGFRCFTSGNKYKGRADGRTHQTPFYCAVKAN